jgi:hypothetical protein
MPQFITGGLAWGKQPLTGWKSASAKSCETALSECGGKQSGAEKPVSEKLLISARAASFEYRV